MIVFYINAILNRMSLLLFLVGLGNIWGKKSVITGKNLVIFYWGSKENRLLKIQTTENNIFSANGNTKNSHEL